MSPGQFAKKFKKNFIFFSPRSLGLVCALVINLEVLQNFTAKTKPKPTATTQPMKTTADALFFTYHLNGQVKPILAIRLKIEFKY